MGVQASLGSRELTGSKKKAEEARWLADDDNRKTAKLIPTQTRQPEQGFEQWVVGITQVDLGGASTERNCNETHQIGVGEDEVQLGRNLKKTKFPKILWMDCEFV